MGSSVTSEHNCYGNYTVRTAVVRRAPRALLFHRFSCLGVLYPRKHLTGTAAVICAIWYHLGVVRKQTRTRNNFILWITSTCVFLLRSDGLLCLHKFPFSHSCYHSKVIHLITVCNSLRVYHYVPF